MTYTPRKKRQCREIAALLVHIGLLQRAGTLPLSDGTYMDPAKAAGVDAEIADIRRRMLAEWAARNAAKEATRDPVTGRYTKVAQEKA